MTVGLARRWWKDIFNNSWCLQAGQPAAVAQWERLGRSAEARRSGHTPTWLSTLLKSLIQERQQCPTTGRRTQSPNVDPH
eukprot:361491-Chlamydomonas_euryale.AAC.6